MKLEVKSINAPVTLMKARDVPVGKVYSWGIRAVSYLRVQGGSVVLEHGQFGFNVLLLKDPENTLHFDHMVEVSNATLTAEYPE
jgi:hypothetical protein